MDERHPLTPRTRGPKGARRAEVRVFIAGGMDARLG